MTSASADPEAPSRVEAAVAYALSSAGTLLWVGCVLPAGRLEGVGLLSDHATPLYREAVLLVPALLLLILGSTLLLLTRGVVGMRGALAAIDTFVCLYAAVALDVCFPCQGTTFWVLTGLLALLGALSAIETARYLRAGARGLPAPTLAGARLALALLVLLAPARLLVQDGTELASLLAPFGFVAFSAAGSRIARTVRGLRVVGGVLLAAIAAHLFVTIRFTVFDAPPRFTSVGPAGWAVTVGAGVLVALATVGVVASAIRRRREAAAHA
jgi:hypothetical protein